MASAFGGYAGIGDEAAPGLDGQIEAHRLLGWDRIELRTIGGVPLAALEPVAFDQVVERLGAARLQVVCVDAAIAGWSRPVSGPLERDLAELDALAPRMAVLGCRFVRVMSYPNDGLAAGAWRREVIARIAALAGRAERHGVVLLHENCAGWAGQAAERTVELVEAVASPALRLVFDTGNGLAYGYEAPEFLEAVLPWVDHVQVKDGTVAAGEARFGWPGEGSGQLAGCLRLLHAAGYAGTLSIEPHLLVAPHLGRLDPGPRGVATFVEYGRRLERLVAEILPAPAAARQGSPP